MEVAFTPASDLPRLATDPDKLKQVLTNLIFNAAEAMGGKGRISLSTLSWRAGMDRGSVEISVNDEGPGLPKEILDRLYQPVTSEKGGEHAGLGLSIVARLVESLGGTLQCNSGPRGTRFKILLPVTSEANG
jgi:signal transduction histidine kinase